MYCPKCEAEYRPGFTDCAHCEVALVEELGVRDAISLDDFDDTAPVCVSSSSELSRIVEVDGRKVDLMRILSLDVAQELRQVLEANGIAQIVTPLEGVEFPDQRPRFELRVRKVDHEKAEAVLRQTWQEGVQAEGTVEEESGQDPEACPACGAHVASDQPECPDCGLFVGVFEDSDGEESDGEEEQA